MIKIKEIYIEPSTSIEFEVKYNKNCDVDYQKKVTIHPNGSYNEKGFVFIDSKIDTVNKIGKALLEIADFCKGLK